MGWRSLLIVSLVVVACVDAVDETTTTSTNETTTTSTTESTTTTETAQPTGRLAVLDGGGNVTVMAPDGSDRVQLTEDGGVDAVYSQPTWSPTGSALAWGQATEDGFALGIKPLGADAADVVPMSNLPFYMFWSPSGEHIGVLHNGANGLDFEMVDVESANSSVLGTGSPFYFSWSPTGDRVVTHVGEERFAIIDLAGEATDLEPTAGGYLAPQWTDRGVVHMADGSLVMEDESGDRSPVAQIEAPITFFVANGDGTRIAAQSLGEGGAVSVALLQSDPITPNAVWVIDVEEGTVERVSAGPALAFFWSPDGDSLLMLVASEGGDRLVPMVWSEDGGSSEYAEFAPSPDLAAQLLPFFPQYAQSMTLWAPGSSAFAYPGLVGDERGIWVQAVAGGAPTLVSEGGWVSWSP